MTMSVPLAKQAIPDAVRVHHVNQFGGNFTNAAVNYFNNSIIATAIGSAMPVSLFAAPRVVQESIWRTVYDRYRVTKFWWRLSIYNSEAFVVESAVFPSNESIANNSSSISSLMLNPNSKRALLAPSTNPNSYKIISGYVDVLTMFGNKTQLYDDAFVGTTTTPTAPTNNIYLILGCYGPNNDVFTAAGIKFVLDVKQEVLYFEKKILTT